MPKVRVLRHEAAMAVGAGGLDHQRALRAVTIDAAKLLGIEKEYGSIEKGKVADLVLYDGDPFEHATHVTHTIMKGTVVYDRADYLKLPFERRILPLLAGGPGQRVLLGGVVNDVTVSGNNMIPTVRFKGRPATLWTLSPALGGEGSPA